MARKPKRRILTGIEIGTSTIKVVMGEFRPDDNLAIVGFGQAPSQQVQKGDVLDVETVLAQLALAVSAAENASGLAIDGPIFVAATGAHIRPVIAVGRTMIQGPGHTVTEEDVVTAVQCARSYSLPPDQKILHTWDRSFQVDDGAKVSNALGRVGDWLAAEVLLIVGQHSPLETTCAMVQELMGCRARDIAFSGVADCFAAFGNEDAELGHLLIDIGAGVTEFVVYQGNGCYAAGQISVGCDHIANDLSIGLHLPQARCKMLVRHLANEGCSVALASEDRQRLIDVRTGSGSGRRVSCASIEKIMALRLGELFHVIRDQLDRHHALDRIGGGVRLCGGGALIPGVTTLARGIFGMPTEVARPRLLSGSPDILDAPHYMTPVGLIRWGRLMLEIDGEEEVPTWRQQFLLEARRCVGIFRDSFTL
jgi:cell division protein FtsA